MKYECMIWFMMCFAILTGSRRKSMQLYSCIFRFTSLSNMYFSKICTSFKRPRCTYEQILWNIDEIHVSIAFSDLSKVLMDEKEFKSDSFQRAIQYLKCAIEDVPLDNFTYTGTIEGTSKQGLTILLR